MRAPRTQESSTPQDTGPRRNLFPWLGSALVVGAAAYFLARAPTDRPLASPAEDEPVVEDVPDADVPSRCKPHGAGSVIGSADAAADGDDVLPPFAPEIGRGTATANGYAVGVKHEAEGGFFASVALVDARAETLQLVPLQRARGDGDAPVVVAHPGGWAAAMLEPNAGGWSLRLAHAKDGGDLTWGAEIAQGRDESLAFDVGFGGDVGVVGWDDVTEKGDRGVIMIAVLTLDSLEGGEDALAVSREEVDAEVPRIVPRDQGFWLAYVARKRKLEDDKRVDAGADPDHYLAERIQPSWIELMPLDKSGKPEGNPRSITDEAGYVLGYDVEPAPGGGVLIAWRGDDAPSGARGGRVTAMLVSASGAGQEQVIVEEQVGKDAPDRLPVGAPTLLPGWIAIADDQAQALVAPLGEDGQLGGELRVEPLLGQGAIIAAREAVLLLARPSSKSIRLTAVECASPDP